MNNDFKTNKISPEIDFEGIAALLEKIEKMKGDKNDRKRNDNAISR